MIMSIKVKKIADSISVDGIRLPTLQLRYPKFIHGELMTHRVFSRNASSSRAIPVIRLVSDVRDDPGMPVYWGKNQKGMQAAEECDALVRDPWTLELVRREEGWRRARESQIAWAMAFDAAGYHKQIVNRRIENDGCINVLVTSTEWANFFALRRDKDAQPEIRVLADSVHACLDASEPKLLFRGEWHLPYVDLVTEVDDITNYLYGIHPGSTQSFIDQHIVDTAVAISAARCARVSYMTHDGKLPNVAADMALYERLAKSRPLHASPMEHQATPDMVWDGRWEHPELHGNFHGWIQARKKLADEYVADR